MWFFSRVAKISCAMVCWRNATSTTRKTKSASCAATQAFRTMDLSSRRWGAEKIPGVSKKWFACSELERRPKFYFVLFGFPERLWQFFCPISAFKRVDFPALGALKIATCPQRFSLTTEIFFCLKKIKSILGGLFFSILFGSAYPFEAGQSFNFDFNFKPRIMIGTCCRENCIMR